MASVNAKLCVLFAECFPPVGEISENVFPSVSEELQGTPRQVVVLKHPSLEDLKKEIAIRKPTIVYCTGGFFPFRDILHAQQNALSFSDTNQDGTPSSFTDATAIYSIFEHQKIETLYVDALLTNKQVEALQMLSCFKNLVYWPSEGSMSAVVASQFAHCFFGMLRNPSVNFSEAFALASRSVQLHCENIVKERPRIQLLPSYIAPKEPELPQCSTIPLEVIPDVNFFDDDVPDVEGASKRLQFVHFSKGWEKVLLLAPKAEVWLLICGGPPTIDAIRLSFLGEALRALLLTEMRSLTVTSMSRCDRVPSNISPGSDAVRCQIKCASGIETIVVLCGPPMVLDNKLLVQHALRQTLAVDSLCLQFRLPPSSFPPTNARSCASVAGGTPVVDALVVTSVWAVHILRGLCQDRSYRSLVSLGVAGVGRSAPVSFNPSDTLRYNTIITGIQNQALSSTKGLPEALPVERPAGELISTTSQRSNEVRSGTNGDMEIDQTESLDNDSDYDIEMDPDYDIGSKTSRDPIIVPMPDISAMDYHSTRPPLSRCSESEFYDDLVAFLEAHRGKPLDRERFPEAVLNGFQLDLFNLYKEVVSRGGFRVGNGINWKGQVFPKMRNWTANHKMTGVGNALKRHYQAFLREYELVHPKDLTGDGCWLCGSNDESATDWICCDHCERWIHFACDRRPFLGTFKDYATGDGGRTYHCPRCSDVLKHL